MARTQFGGDQILDKSIEENDLADAVNAYADKSPKIYRLSGYSNNHTQIDYTILDLYPVRTFIQGELQNVEWYNDNALTDRVLTVDIVYARDNAGFAVSRTTRRRWVNNDGTYNAVESNTHKDYTLNRGETIQEGKLRRQALIDNMQLKIMYAMFETMTPIGWTETQVILEGRRFLDDYETLFSKFVKNSSTVNSQSNPDYGMKKVVVALRDETDVDFLLWFTKTAFSLDGRTIREFMILEFEI